MGPILTATPPLSEPAVHGVRNKTVLPLWQNNYTTIARRPKKIINLSMVCSNS